MDEQSPLVGENVRFYRLIEDLWSRNAVGRDGNISGTALLMYETVTKHVSLKLKRFERLDRRHKV